MATTKTIEKPFPNAQEVLFAFNCGYCRKSATTIRHGIAVCRQHEDLWPVGLPIYIESPAAH